MVRAAAAQMVVEVMMLVVAVLAQRLWKVGRWQAVQSKAAWTEQGRSQPPKWLG